MTEPTTTEAAPRPRIDVPIMCNRHRMVFLRQKMGLGKRGPWRAAEAAAHLLLADALFVSPVVIAKADGKVENASAVFASLGCPACFLPDGALDAIAAILHIGPRYFNAVRTGRIRDDGWVAYLRTVAGFDAPPTIAEVRPS